MRFKANSPPCVRARHVSEVALGREVVRKRVEVARPPAPTGLGRRRGSGIRPPPPRPWLGSLLATVRAIDGEPTNHVGDWTVQRRSGERCATACRAARVLKHLLNAALHVNVRLDLVLCPRRERGQLTEDSAQCSPRLDAR